MQSHADEMHFTSGAVTVPEISVKVSQSKGWQVCVGVCERKKERGRVRDPSFWQIAFKDLPHEMSHRCGYRSVYSTERTGT